jgi:hypothetical protein
VEVYPASTSITIPFAETLWESIPPSYKRHSRLNRDGGILLTAITTVTKMRTMISNQLPQTIEATLEDYGVVRDVFGSAFSTAAGTLSAAKQRVYDWVAGNPGKTATEIASGIEITQQTASFHLRSLGGDMALLAHDGVKRNQHWSVIAEAPDGVQLPTVEELREAWEWSTV